jgi:2-oxoglutarate dehydrogenase E2 component (dihydrolipoamide succinyltransferase)
MPAAAKMMAESGLAASQVAGTGRDGRITKGDVIGAVAAQSQTPAPAAIPTGAPAGALPVVKAPVDIERLTEGRPEQRVPMSRLRQRVAERLLQSQATNAILTRTASRKIMACGWDSCLSS